MARREITQYFDDLDNTPLSEDQVNIVNFTVNGVDYTMDLSEENKRRFDDTMTKYIGVARRRGRATTRRTGSPNNSATAARNRAIRAWANENNIPVSSRGRISSDVVEAYERANNR